MIRSVLYLLLVTVLTGCAPAANPLLARTASASGFMNGVVNGQTAVAADVAVNGVAQSVVMIIVQLADGEALCTGTLIGPRIVLTAGHCVGDGAKPENLTVILHPTKFPRTLTGYEVQDFTVNPAFLNQGMNNQDLALLLLAKPVAAGTPIATLPPAMLDYTQIPQIMTIGYGVSDDRHGTPMQNNGAGTLRYTTFPQTKFKILQTASDAKSRGMLVALADTTSMCTGDSGGPVFSLLGSGQSSNVVIAVNESVIAGYKGQQQTDFQAAQKANDLSSFYAKYPDASTCEGGYNLAVSTAALRPWIITTQTQLLSEPAPSPLRNHNLLVRESP